MDADPAAAARPGERWVVRVRLGDGGATDVIGWVEQATPTSLLVGTTTVDRANVIAARRAPAAGGGPPPGRLSATDLERIALPGWLAEHAPLGEWTLRAGGGFTGRANSCLAVGDPGLPIEQATATIRAWSRDHAIPAWAQVVVGSAEEAALRGSGWTPTYVPTAVLAVRLAELLGSGAADPAVGVSEELSPGWLAAYEQSRPTTAPEQVVRTILTDNPPRAFAAIGAGDQPTAIARGHLSADWLGLAAIWTRPPARRQGLATALIGALGHWAARRGARYGYLQVAAANTAAIAAYQRLGFAEHHRYGYLAAPEASV